MLSISMYNEKLLRHLTYMYVYVCSLNIRVQRFFFRDLKKFLILGPFKAPWPGEFEPFFFNCTLYSMCRLYSGSVVGCEVAGWMCKADPQCNMALRDIQIHHTIFFI